MTVESRPRRRFALPLPSTSPARPAVALHREVEETFGRAPWVLPVFVLQVLQAFGHGCAVDTSTDEVPPVQRERRRVGVQQLILKPCPDRPLAAFRSPEMTGQLPLHVILEPVEQAVDIVPAVQHEEHVLENGLHPMLRPMYLSPLLPLCDEEVALRIPVDLHQPVSQSFQPFSEQFEQSADTHFEILDIRGFLTASPAEPVASLFKTSGSLRPVWV